MIMAQLAKKPYPGNWDFDANKGSDEYFKRTQAMLDKIPSDKIVSFPVADGSAMYFVKFTKTSVTLQHIPYGDAWQIPSAHIRGLRKADVEHLLGRAAGLKKLFAEAKARQAK